MTRRISITGDIGSGKTTIAALVGQRLGLTPLSTGGIQRRLAASLGIDTNELNRRAEADPAIDEAIDDHLRALPAGPLVVESRMAWRFVPETLKVFLYTVPQVAAERILAASRNDERYADLSDAVKAIGDRRQSEIHRYGKYYDVDISDLRNYDLVIDTTESKPDVVADKILAHPSAPSAVAAWLCPTDLVPTQAIGDIAPHEIARHRALLAGAGGGAGEPVSVLYVDHIFCVFDGHAGAAAAIREGVPLVAARIVAIDDEACPSGVTARRYAAAAVSDQRAHDWEAALGFRFRQPIWRSVRAN